MRKIFSTSLLLLFVVHFLSAQQEEKKETNVAYNDVLLLSPVFGIQFPGADLAKRFGITYDFGLSVDYKFKANWQVGAEGGFLFGTNVKESDHITSQLIRASGQTITNEGSLDDVNLNMRGALLKINVGKGFYFRKEQPNSGLLLKFGVGYLQHKILIDVNNRVTPQLTDDYAKGYDRFSNGFVMSQYIGLIKVNKGKFINLALGFELTEAFTANRRPYDFHLKTKISNTRVDLMYGIKLNWYIPVYLGKSTNNDYYYY